MFEFEWKCRWDNVDPAQIAYFPEMVNACHQAGDAFMEHIDWPYWDNPTVHEISLPIVESGYNFKSPVRVGDVITIAVNPKVGESSVRLEFTATHEDGTPAFEGFEQHVCVPMHGNEHGESSQPLPDGLRDALKEYEE